MFNQYAGNIYQIAYLIPARYAIALASRQAGLAFLLISIYAIFVRL